MYPQLIKHHTPELNILKITLNAISVVSPNQEKNGF